ncbi:MAG TPA: DUF5667 domain-containing protein [Jatrophihabitantaceae bacterium]|jgi:hypothetical protein|nr:DUF5667 domain-containing protein [Jatrophihabitantaceae bacterium]
MAEHRVPMLGAALRRHADPSRSRDPQVRELVSALATLEVAPAPREDFRAELRAQLVAVTPRLVEEGKAELSPAGQPAKHAPAPERQRLRLKKPLIAALGVLTAFVLLLGGAVLLSQNSLPGDTLYGLKRASENTEYSLAGSSVDKGKLKLEFAARRIGEVSDLLGSVSALAGGRGVLADGAAINSRTANLVRETLSSANSDVTSAARLLGDAAVHQNSAGPLDDMTTWARDQLVKMGEIVQRTSTDNALHAQAMHTRQLIADTAQRAEALKANLGSNGTPVAPGKTGPPSRTSTGPSPTASSGAPKPGITAPSTTAGRTPSSTPRATSSAPPDNSSTPNPPASSSPPKPRISLPVTLPTSSLPGGGGGGKSHAAPTPPVGVDSCGLNVTLGPIGIGVGDC